MTDRPWRSGAFLFAETAFLTGHQLGDIASVAIDEKRTHDQHGQGHGAKTEQQAVVEHCKHRRHQRGERRIAEKHGDDNPGGRGCQPEPEVDRKQYSGRSGDTFAAGPYLPWMWR